MFERSGDSQIFDLDAPLVSLEFQLRERSARFTGL
jgi:hypothetical protein